MRRISFAVVVAIALGGVFGVRRWPRMLRLGCKKQVTLRGRLRSRRKAPSTRTASGCCPTARRPSTSARRTTRWSSTGATYNGYRRYHGECHVCHGPNGLGSTYAPALADSLKTMDYGTFLGTVASGRVRDEAGTKFVMPAFGDNKNVMCFINDLYVYLEGPATRACPPVSSAVAIATRSRSRQRQKRRLALVVKKVHALSTKAWSQSAVSAFVAFWPARRSPSKVTAPTSSIARCCASAPILRTFHSRTRRRKASRTRSRTSSANELKVPVEYTWFPQATGFTRNTLSGQALRRHHRHRTG